MKPKTKLQHQVVALHLQLPKITDKQQRWAFKNCLYHKATRLKSGITTCLDCGYRWKDNSKQDNCICPKCETKLRVEYTRIRNFYNWSYYSIITTFNEFQVIRFYKVIAAYKVGKQPDIYCSELSQIWMHPTGKFEIMGYIHIRGFYKDVWTGNFELRNKKYIYKYDLQPDKFYPKKKYLSEIKRNGFKGNFHGFSPFSLFRLILLNRKAETLLKSKQFDLLIYCKSNAKKIDLFWSSIKISIRNEYLIEDASLWIDYLELLFFFNKDLNSTKYVCPENLNRAHDKLMSKKREIERREKQEEQKRKLAEDQIKYENQKRQFFGLEFNKKNISVKVIETVREFMEEGDLHKHCVYTNEFYKKTDSLILSAKVEGKPLETIEVSLSNMNIVQSRGLHNQPYKYNKEIIDLVKNNIHLIQNIHLKKKKRRKKTFSISENFE